MRNEKSFSADREQGAALIVVLMLLLIVTLLGLAAMRGAILQERMASATLQRAKTFQSAESALRLAETVVAAAKPQIPGTGCNTLGVCAMTAPGATPTWATSGFWTSGKAVTAPVENNGVTSYYVIEDYGLSENLGGSLDPAQGSTGSTAEVYRIVSHAETPGGGSEVNLQSIYRVKR